MLNGSLEISEIHIQLKFQKLLFITTAVFVIDDDVVAQGAWQPSLNISTVLTSIGLLLSDPNPDDGLMAEIVRNFSDSCSMIVVY